VQLATPRRFAKSSTTKSTMHASILGLSRGGFVGVGCRAAEQEDERQWALSEREKRRVKPTLEPAPQGLGDSWVTVHVKLTKPIPADDVPGATPVQGYYLNLGIRAAPGRVLLVVANAVSDGAIEWEGTEWNLVDPSSLDRSIRNRIEPVAHEGIWYRVVGYSTLIPILSHRFNSRAVRALLWVTMKLDQRNLNTGHLTACTRRQAERRRHLTVLLGHPRGSSIL